MPDSARATPLSDAVTAAGVSLACAWASKLAKKASVLPPAIDAAISSVSGEMFATTAVPAPLSTTECRVVPPGTCTLSTQGRTAFSMLTENLPSAPVVAVAVPVAHLTLTVALASAWPTAAVPLIWVERGAGGVGASDPPPPHAVSTAAAIVVARR